MKLFILITIILMFYSCSPKYKYTGIIIKGKHHVLVGGNWRKMQIIKLHKQNKKEMELVNY